MAVPLPVLAIQAQHALQIVRQLAADLAALSPCSDRIQAMHLEIAGPLPHGAVVLLCSAVDHLRAAVRETPVASCVLTAADRAEAREASDRG